MHAPVALATHEWTPAGTDTPAATPVAVLVHGVTGWHRTWWRVGPALAECGWRAIAVDLRGHGRSPRIDGHATVSDWAADLAGVIEAVGAPVDAVIGHSLGAAVSAELAYLRPDLLNRLVLEDPPAISRANDIAWHANLEREMLDAHAQLHVEIERELAQNPAWLPEDARQDVEGKQLADREGLLASFRRPTGARVPELVRRIQVPTLYLLGEDGRSVYGGEARRRLEKDLPDNARMLVADAGHTIHRDRFDWYVTTIVGWLSG